MGRSLKRFLKFALIVDVLFACPIPPYDPMTENVSGMGWLFTRLGIFVRYFCELIASVHKLAFANLKSREYPLTLGVIPG
jgi:hypothetical protein